MIEKINKIFNFVTPSKIYIIKKMSQRITPNPKKFKFLPLLCLLATLSLFNLSLTQDVPDMNNLELIFVYEHARHGARGILLHIIPYSKMGSMNSKYHGKEKEMVN